MNQNKKAFAEKEKKTGRKLYFYKILKSAAMRSTIPIESTDKILEKLRPSKYEDADISAAPGRRSYSEDISERIRRDDAFRYVKNDMFFDFYILSDVEIFAVFGKMDQPANAHVKAKNTYIDDFVLEYYTYLYCSVKDDVLCVMEGNRTPKISEAFQLICNCATADFEYEVVGIQDSHILEKFRRATAVQNVKIKLAAPKMEILQDRALGVKALAFINENQFEIEEAKFTFKPKKRTTQDVTLISKLAEVFSKKTQNEVREFSVSFFSDELKEELIKATDNFYTKAVSIPVSHKIDPMKIYEEMKKAYTENRTEVLSCLLGKT